MSRDRIVPIGPGLYRLTVRSKGRRDLYARLPGVRVEDGDAEYLGYRIIFSEALKPFIAGTLKRRPRREDDEAKQIDLFKP